MLEYRWLTSDETINLVNPCCAQMGWSSLNVNKVQPTCRVLGAFDGPALVAFLAVQLFPVIGPAWADADHRDGKVSRELADRMHEFMQEVKARGALMLCESVVAERLAERHGMTRVNEPVYMWLGDANA
jgi:hypothetical protein